MRIRMYQATDGDCLLIESSGPEVSRMLIDGGRKGSFRDHAAGDLEGRDLDLVVVSHIDSDHISGIVEMFDEKVAWTVYRIHEGRLEENRAGLSAEDVAEFEQQLQRLLPKSVEPPAVAAVWHNAFQDQVNHGSEVPFAQSQIDDFLITAMRMQLLDSMFDEGLEDTANVAQGVKEAVILRNRLSKEQLGLPVNGPATPEKLIFLGDDSGAGSVLTEGLAVGEFLVRILGPSRGDLVRLEKLWRNWVRDNEAVAKELREAAQEESERLHGTEPIVFGSILANLAGRLGDGSTITPPNLASLLMLVEQGEKSLLLTGDGKASEVLRGLRAHGLLAPDGPLEGDDNGDGLMTTASLPESVHVDVLKIPHHGASDNIDADGFFSLVTADHYLFCGNGSHHNPERDVVEQVLEVRGDLVSTLGDYHLWFSSSQGAANTTSRKDHMEMIEELVEDQPGCEVHFLQEWKDGESREGRSYATIDVG